MLHRRVPAGRTSARPRREVALRPRSGDQPHSVLCDRTAAWIHGIDVLRYAELDVVPPVETYVLRGHHPTDRSECAGGTRDLVPEDWMDVRRACGSRRRCAPPSTSPASCRDARRSRRSTRSCATHGFTHRDLQRLLRRYCRRRGVVQARDAGAAGRRQVRVAPRVVDASGDQRSRAAVARRRSTGCSCDGVPTYRLDLAYPHARIAVEYDGEDVPLQPERSRRVTRSRRTWLRDARDGTVIVLTKAQLHAGRSATAWIRTRSRLPR